MIIGVVGCGYVGLSLAVLISQKYEVRAFDISEEKIKNINDKKSPIKDTELEEFLQNKPLNLIATSDKEVVYKNSDYVIIATPTNYDIESGSFDTSTVEDVIGDCIELNENATIVIKSTVPLGFTDSIRKKYKKRDIFFSPEFLRESKALYDNLYPARIVMGDTTKKAQIFSKILTECSNLNPNEISLINMGSKEAEAVKLFSNTFLAMRIAFFNELDSFSEIYDLSPEKIIAGVSADPRIGNYYNNPSFGYGGYCLPKDTKQLLDNYQSIPNKLIKAVVEANQTRKGFIVESILKKNPKTVGVYRIIMKEGSDNFRESAVLDIINDLIQNDVKLILFEPLIFDDYFDGIRVIRDIGDFINQSDLIIANRLSNELENVIHKVYSRDIFREN